MACIREQAGRKLPFNIRGKRILIQLVGTLKESRRIDQSTLKVSSLRSMTLVLPSSATGVRSFSSASPFLGYFKTTNYPCNSIQQTITYITTKRSSKCRRWKWDGRKSASQNVLRRIHSPLGLTRFPCTSRSLQSPMQQLCFSKGTCRLKWIGRGEGLMSRLPQKYPSTSTEQSKSERMALGTRQYVQ